MSPWDGVAAASRGGRTAAGRWSARAASVGAAWACEPPTLVLSPLALARLSGPEKKLLADPMNGKPGRHVPWKQVYPAVHRKPHPPQLKGSNPKMLAQKGAPVTGFAQGRRPGLQEKEQAGRPETGEMEQVVMALLEVGQASPHAPQLSGSAARLTQLLVGRRPESGLLAGLAGSPTVPHWVGKEAEQVTEQAAELLVPYGPHLVAPLASKGQE